MDISQSGRYGNGGKYQEEEANYLIPEDVQRTNHARDYMAQKFSGELKHRY